MVVKTDATVSTRARRGSLGPALRQAWVGYRRRLDDEVAAAGFADHGLPDGRVLRICARATEPTTSQVARELGMTRQGAGKIVASLRDRRYVKLVPSTTDAREKAIVLTPRAHALLAAHRKAARKIEREVRAEAGDDAFAALARIVDALRGPDQPRMRDYLRQASHGDVLGELLGD
jgi:DNA-binding MarR family transcriptional regulator